MKKVTVYQAKDGTNFPTPKECAEHDKKLKLAPAIKAFAERTFTAHVTPGVQADDRGQPVIYMDDSQDLADFISAHAEELTKALTEPLIIRRPRKAKKELIAAGVEVGSYS